MEGIKKQDLISIMITAIVGCFAGIFMLYPTLIQLLYRLSRVMYQPRHKLKRLVLLVKRI